jgi:hypothetical protein
MMDMLQASRTQRGFFQPEAIIKFTTQLDREKSPVVFLDVSGSTTSDRFYWNSVADILSRLADAHDTVVYPWSSELIDLAMIVPKGASHSDVVVACNLGRIPGWGHGTNPAATVPKIKELVDAGVRDVVFVTDGQIGEREDDNVCKALRKGAFTLGSLVAYRIGPYASTSVWTAFSWCAETYRCVRVREHRDPETEVCSKAELAECIAALDADVMAIADDAFRAKFARLLHVYASNPDGDLAQEIHQRWTTWLKNLRKKERDAREPVRFPDLPEDQRAACNIVFERYDSIAVPVNHLFDELARIKPRGIEANLEPEAAGRYATSGDLPAPSLENKEFLEGSPVMVLPELAEGYEHPEHWLTMPVYMGLPPKIVRYSMAMGDMVIVPDERFSGHNRLVVAHALCRGKAIGSWILWLAGALLSLPRDLRDPVVSDYVIQLLSTLDYSFTLGGLDVDKPKGNVFDAFRYSIGKTTHDASVGDGDLVAATFMLRRRIEMLELQVPDRNLLAEFRDVLEVADFVRSPAVAGCKGPDGKIRRSTLKYVEYLPLDGAPGVYLDSLVNKVPRALKLPKIQKAKGLTDNGKIPLDPKTFKHDFDHGFTHSSYLELCRAQDKVPLPLYAIARRMTVELGRFPTWQELIAAGAKKMANLTGSKVVSSDIVHGAQITLAEFADVVRENYDGDESKAVAAIASTLQKNVA